MQDGFPKPIMKEIDFSEISPEHTKSSKGSCSRCIQIKLDILTLHSFQPYLSLRARPEPRPYSSTGPGTGWCSTWTEWTPPQHITQGLFNVFLVLFQLGFLSVYFWILMLSSRLNLKVIFRYLETSHDLIFSLVTAIFIVWNQLDQSALKMTYG